jgi:hypothetical protein
VEKSVWALENASVSIRLMWSALKVVLKISAPSDENLSSLAKARAAFVGRSLATATWRLAGMAAASPRLSRKM